MRGDMSPLASGLGERDRRGHGSHETTFVEHASRTLLLLLPQDCQYCDTTIIDHNWPREFGVLALLCDKSETVCSTVRTSLDLQGINLLTSLSAIWQNNLKHNKELKVLEN